jgi:HSP20 family molecular chaperone IbpA
MFIDPFFISSIATAHGVPPRDISPPPPIMKLTNVDGANTLTVEIPGCNRDHVSVKCEGSKLAIVINNPYQGKKLTESFNISSRVDSSSITASCADGLLTIRLPLKTSEQPRTIPVT